MFGDVYAAAQSSRRRVLVAQLETLQGNASGAGSISSTQASSESWRPKVHPPLWQALSLP
jgi:hypothetical protein